ncbi:hypothetical protein ABLE93_12100 [Xanthobacter sp. KR7-65]|uniref:bestrophin-like domain n=1 Tax=Xanthobacter sp. KR7-65 TaxID=3156612 RepID=UPI0032B3FEDF
MQAWLVAVLVFMALQGGALWGMWSARWLKAHHLSKETQEAVKLGVGMVAAMASLILGLMTASVKGNFDTTGKDIQQYATYLTTLDASLRHFGPGAEPARSALLAYTVHAINETWPETPGAPKVVSSRGSEQLLQQVGHEIRILSPLDPEQTDLRAEALDRFKSLAALRWTLIAESVTEVPPIFVLVLIIWLTLIFISFGLFSPVNAVALTAFPLCALSLAGAIFLILEMSSPFDGIIMVGPNALQQSLSHMQAP